MHSVRSLARAADRQHVQRRVALLLAAPRRERQQPAVGRPPGIAVVRPGGDRARRRARPVSGSCSSRGRSSPLRTQSAFHPATRRGRRPTYVHRAAARRSRYGPPLEPIPNCLLRIVEIRALLGRQVRGVQQSASHDRRRPHHRSEPRDRCRHRAPRRVERLRRDRQLRPQFGAAAAVVDACRNAGVRAIALWPTSPTRPPSSDVRHHGRRSRPTTVLVNNAGILHEQMRFDR